MGTPRRDRDTARMNLVIGLGEIGRPLMEVLRKAHRVEGIDLAPRDVPGPIDLMHVCYPGDIPDFAGETAKYVRRYKPSIVVIHSTVPVGTTRAVQALVPVPVVHSPVRGKHARMVEELVNYVKFVGGTTQDAVANTMAMTHITLGRNSGFTLPALNFGGTPAGIDARKVVDTGILPVINTGIAHRKAGIGQIGAGVTHAPLACFTNAIAALARQVSV